MPSSGYLLINKPAGPTSHDIIDALRRLTGLAKIGHAGTLDPFASGLLICAVGREATKSIAKFVKLDKEYIATLHLGAVSDTHDKTGKIISRPTASQPALEAINAVIARFIGPQEQLPPMYSAKKINGRKLYELARSGKVVERQPSNIEIFNLAVLNYSWPHLSLKINCSSGTYIRSLAFDLGEGLGCGAYVAELQRTAIGQYRLEQAITLAELTTINWTERLFI